jgi:O-antigen/teichoic acid export membrane protein
MDGSELASRLSGWLALALIFVAGFVPIGVRLRAGRRAATRSRPIGIHVALGTATALAAFVHGLLALTSLGSSSAIAGGDLALAAGAGALLVLMAHIGIGLQLRDPKLRERQRMRGKHIATALTIAILALAHAIMLWTAG